MKKTGDALALAQLMRLGLGRLGLTPDAFWNLTPAELMLMLGMDPGQESLSRERFRILQDSFPDTPRTSRIEME